MNLALPSAPLTSSAIEFQGKIANELVIARIGSVSVRLDLRLCVCCINAERGVPIASSALANKLVSA